MVEFVVKVWQQAHFICLLGIGTKLQQNQWNYLNIVWKKIIEIENNYLENKALTSEVDILYQYLILCVGEEEESYHVRKCSGKLLERNPFADKQFLGQCAVE